MKLQSILAAGAFAAITAISFPVQAADADKAPEAQAPAAKPAPHSHVQEKTGMAPPAKAEKPAAAGAEAAKPAKKNAAKDKSKHYHPRDMK